jgi:thiol-disulfide isomerase/thioredoxin
MKTILLLCVTNIFMLSNTAAREAIGPKIEAHFTDAHLAGFKSMTLPRTFLYDANNVLIPQENWPTELAGLKEHVGAAYCCVSDLPQSAEQKGPPADCQRIIYGQNIVENFTGLRDQSNKPVLLANLPTHKHLLVEYFATWCSPCLTERKALTAFFATPVAKDYVWLAIDVTRLPEAKEAAKKMK